MFTSQCSRLFKRPLVIAIAVIVTACAGTAPQASLYERLGGLLVITSIVDQAVDLHANDPRTRRSFEGINLKMLKASIVSQVCNATGGPCKYEGAPMDKAHQGLDISAPEFDTAVEHIGQALDRLKVGPNEKKEFLQMLAPMKSEIVTR